MAVGDAEGQVAAVLAGHGIAQLPTWLIRRQLEDGSLVQVLAPLATDGLPIHLAWLKSRQAQPKVATLLTHLRQCLSGTVSSRRRRHRVATRRAPGRTFPDNSYTISLNPLE